MHWLAVILALIDILNGCADSFKALEVIFPRELESLIDKFDWHRI